MAAVSHATPAQQSARATNAPESPPHHPRLSAKNRCVDQRSGAARPAQNGSVGPGDPLTTRGGMTMPENRTRGRTGRRRLVAALVLPAATVASILTAAGMATGTTTTPEAAATTTAGGNTAVPPGTGATTTGPGTKSPTPSP